MPEILEEERLERCIVTKNTALAAEIYQELHEADLALLLKDREVGERKIFFDLLGLDRAAEILEYLPVEQIEEEISAWPPSSKSMVLNHLADDTLVDFFQNFDQEERETLFPLLTEEKRRVTRELLNYPEHTAGGRMTTAFAAVRVDMNVRDAKNMLRGQQEQAEILARIFVVDEAGHLVGKMRLRDLAFARGDTPVQELMEKDPESAEVLMDEVDAARLVEKYDLVALPVVNPQGVLVGILTHDDALDILQDESGENMERFMAITGTDEGDRGYLEMSAFTHFKRRVIWLVVLAGLGIVSGYVIYHFEEVLSQFFILAIYMPMLAAAGGNTGAQSATLVIRAMSLGEFQPKDILLIVWKELRVGLMLALVLAAVSGAKVLFMSGGHADGGPSLATFALIVSLALGIQVITSSVFGAILPMLAKMAKLDPAVVASPAITTFVDVSGLLIYFSIAKWVLGI